MRPSLGFCGCFKQHFNPRTPRGVRPVLLHDGKARGYFNPRTPRGVRLAMVTVVQLIFLFQSTHPSRGATKICISLLKTTAISIHAPLAGCDIRITVHDRWVLISIHAPLAGCDVVAVIGVITLRISIHAPLAGCDVLWGTGLRLRKHFNPRTPRGVRRIKMVHLCQFPHFNPRTPRGVRLNLSIHPKIILNFNPRTPRGVRRVLPTAIITALRFQSTHPSRGATLRPSIDRFCVIISIHAPLAGCDCCICV